jgi:histidinol-phosphatase (PHP family)
MCRAAYENNLIAIGFSAHAPIFNKTGIKTHWNMPDEKLPEYAGEVRAAKSRWQGKLDVYLGLEVDFISSRRSATDSDIKAINADYLIGSVHYIVPANGIEPFTVDGDIEEVQKGIKEGFGGDTEAFMQCYYDTVAEMIETGGFEIIGHADVIKKNFNDNKIWPEEKERERQKEIARAAAKAGLVVEVNTGGLNRNRVNEVYPDETFLRYFCENNVSVIITSDAHRAEHICGNYDIAQKTLISAGFSEHVIFSGKKDNKAIWNKIKINN